VAILYCVSTVFGLAAVVLTTSGRTKALVLVLAFLAIGTIAAFVFSSGHRHHEEMKEASHEEEKDRKK